MSRLDPGAPAAILRCLLDNADVLMEGPPAGDTFLLVRAPADLRDQLEQFGADTIDDEDADPAEDDDPAGGAVEDEGEPQPDDEL